MASPPPWPRPPRVWPARRSSRPHPPRRPHPPPPASPPPRNRDARFHRGASLGLFAREGDAPYRRSIYAAFLDEMTHAGVTHVQLVTRWAQADVRATTITPDAESDDDTLRWAIGAARERGLRVFLMPILHVHHRPPGQWRGTLAPTDPTAWWTAYHRFILHYGRLAAATGVALFAVGSELVSTEQQTDRWRALITAVRAVFPGQLTYSANWDHFEPVSFWDALDIAGLNAYHPLTPRPAPTEAELIAGWRPFMQRVRHWSNITGKPYLFTEIGYPTTHFAAARPWDHNLRGPPDPELQLRCYRALFETWQQDPRLIGLYLWNWFGFGGPDDLGYTPRGKPALFVIDHWYRGSR